MTLMHTQSVQPGMSLIVLSTKGLLFATVIKFASPTVAPYKYSAVWKVQIHIRLDHTVDADREVPGLGARCKRLGQGPSRKVNGGAIGEMRDPFSCRNELQTLSSSAIEWLHCLSRYSRCEDL